MRYYQFKKTLGCIILMVIENGRCIFQRQVPQHNDVKKAMKEAIKLSKSIKGDVCIK